MISLVRQNYGSTMFKGKGESHTPGEISVRQAKRLERSNAKALVDTCVAIGNGTITPSKRNFGLLSNFANSSAAHGFSPDFLVAVRKQLEVVAKGGAPEAPRTFSEPEIRAMQGITKDLPEVARKVGQGTFGAEALKQLGKLSTAYSAVTQHVMGKIGEAVGHSRI